MPRRAPAGRVAAGRSARVPLRGRGPRRPCLRQPAHRGARRGAPATSPPRIAEAGRLLGAVGAVLPGNHRAGRAEGRSAQKARRGTGADHGGPRRERGSRSCHPMHGRRRLAVERLLAADQIVIGPGSLYTSVLAACAVPALRRAIAASASPACLRGQSARATPGDGGLRRGRPRHAPSGGTASRPTSCWPILMRSRSATSEAGVRVVQARARAAAISSDHDVPERCRAASPGSSRGLRER